VPLPRCWPELGSPRDRSSNQEGAARIRPAGSVVERGGCCNVAALEEPWAWKMEQLQHP
jgi:hypothetical protein